MALASNAYVLDSSVWVALFLDGDTNHKKAVTAFEPLVGPVYVPYIVLAEVATVLTYRHSKQQADNFVQFVLNDARCIILESRSSNDTAAFLKVGVKISYADTAVIEYARDFGAALITFDKQMKRAYDGWV